MDDINGRIADVMAGDLHAFEEIYKQTIDQVYRTLYFLTDNTRELDDLVQEIYVELFRSLAAFDPSRSFPAWLYGITIRQHQAYRRKRWKQRRNDATGRQASAERAEPDFSLMVIDKVANQQIMDDIASLSSKLKQVIILHYLNELTQEEIAEILGIPLGTVKSRLHLALTKLRSRTGRDSACMKG